MTIILPPALALLLLGFASILAHAQTESGIVISAAHRDYDPVLETGPGLAGLSVSLGKRGIARSADLRSWWVNVNVEAGTYHQDYKSSKLEGNFTGVTLSVYTENDIQYRYSVRSGSGDIRTAEGLPLAEGNLDSISDYVVIQAKPNAQFTMSEYLGPVTFSPHVTSPTTFPKISLLPGNVWKIDEPGFKFLLTINSLRQPVLVTLLPDSIAYASTIRIPKGEALLFGYKISASTPGATVRFRLGSVVECLKCKAIRF